MDPRVILQLAEPKRGKCNQVNYQDATLLILSITVTCRQEYSLRPIFTLIFQLNSTLYIYIFSTYYAYATDTTLSEGKHY